MAKDIVIHKFSHPQVTVLHKYKYSYALLYRVQCMYLPEAEIMNVQFR